ncbi:MAG: CocE/NonD family hydrolase, partial [Acidobacteria bacterium]|nr:CocE/NonD family hydrolase [Acidobacteriota bacterium]
MRRVLATAMAVAVVANVSTQAPQPQQSAGVVVDKTVRVPMRDGVTLSTHIYRPGRGGAPLAERLPVLLHRTPYALDEGLSSRAEYFAQHGYVSVLQNIRGRFASGGRFVKYDPLGAQDGYDTIEWLAKLPYADGGVGMWGSSYAAHTQADAAKMNPPSLRALLLNNGGMSNAWDHAVRLGGAFELGRELTWAWRSITEDRGELARKHLAGEDVEEWYAAMPFREGLSPLSVAPEFERYFLDELTRSDYGPYWQGLGMNWSDYYRQTADVPMLHVGGWYDIFLRGTIDNFIALSKLKKSPMRLLVGPWDHGAQARTYAGDVEFGPSAAIPDFFDAFHVRWFDTWLKGQKTGVEQEAPIHLFVMGTGSGAKTAEGRLVHGGVWRDAQQWPLPEARDTAYYFHADGSLRTEPPRNGSPSTTYTFEPGHPVPTIGGSTTGRIHGGAYNQRERADFVGSRPPYLPLRSRSDVLVFQTEPLAADTTVIGPVTVSLFASSSAVDTDFTAKLVDVYPPSEDFPAGFDLNITDAIVRARYRGERPTQKLIEPGRVYEFLIRPFPTANVFKKGHRIRVDISSTHFPRFDVNPHTGEPLGQN